jgi:hypothetical protein
VRGEESHPRTVTDLACLPHAFILNVTSLADVTFLLLVYKSIRGTSGVALILGASSNCIGTSNGQSFYATFWRGMSEGRLKDLGIYLLPDGGEIVATKCATGEYCLYTLEEWRHFGLAEYLLDQQGQILRHGKPTGWKLEDLQDMGRVAEYYVHANRHSP